MRTINILSRNDVLEIVKDEIERKFEQVELRIQKLKIRLNDIERIIENE